MQQRRLRLGDILDDYCPRERRITNHVVVAMIEDDVRQTRCTTCDAEHEYKQAKVPAPRRKKSGALSLPVEEGAIRVAPSPASLTDDLPDEDLLDVSDETIAPEPEADTAYAVDAAESADPADAVDTTAASDATDALDAADADEESDDAIGNRMEDDGPVHRRLIRATLPRPDGHVPERKEPDFTMRHPGGRDFNGNRNGNGNGNQSRHRGRHAQGGQFGGGQNRFGGSRPGGGQRQGSPQAGGQGGHGGQRQGNRPGQPGQPGQNRGGGRPGGQNRGNGRKRGR